MDLYLFPEAACKNDGYGIGVDFAYHKNPPKAEDLVIWYTSYPQSQMLHVRSSDVILRRFGLLSIKSVRNILSGRIRSELTFNELAFLKNYSIDNIYSDDVLFYRILRQLFPEKRIHIRFHNCFSRIYIRNTFLKRNVGLKYSITLKNMRKLENEIFNDRNVYKIFISDEDRDFYISTYGIVSDSETWHYLPNEKLINVNRKGIVLSNKLVWFGGVESHKESSILWFINNVFPRLRNKNPYLEFHLWGKNTVKFNSPDTNVFGHGFFSGEGMPFADSLYVNPDIIGGGIKLKLMTLLENGVPFISTPFGFEGYSPKFIDGKYCHVVEEDKWVDAILSILEKYKA